jgi:hypothetical protein
MKKCPNCQKTFDDDKRFCQIDGTPLIDEVEPPPAEDPFKTVVMGSQQRTDQPDDGMKTMVMGQESKEEDILQIPETFDPMKTMVVSEPIKFDRPSPPKPEEPAVPTPEPPKFNEPSISPPSFGDLSSSEPKKNDPPPVETPKVNPFSEPPKIDSPFSPPPTDPPKFDPPVSGGFGDDSPFMKPQTDPIPSPFEVKETPVSPPPFKDPEPAFGAPPSPFESTPFNPTSEPVNQPLQQNEWTPPPAPVQSWEDQPVGQNTPFQPPAAGTGSLNQTLPIVSLVLGILSLCCYISPITGIAALITGFMGMKNVNRDPATYGGKTLAIIGMILGGLFFLVGVAYYIYVFVLIGYMATR